MLCHSVSKGLCQKICVILLYHGACIIFHGACIILLYHGACIILAEEKNALQVGKLKKQQATRQRY